MAEANPSFVVGDDRFQDSLAALASAPDRAAALRAMPFDRLLQALAAASRERDPLLANVIATELLNRYRRGVPLVAAAAVGLVVGALLGFVATASFAAHPYDFPDGVFVIVLLGALLVGLLVGALALRPLRHALLVGRRA